MMMVRATIHKGRSKADVYETVDRAIAICDDMYTFTKKSVATAKREAWRQWCETGDQVLLCRTIKECLKAGQKDLNPSPWEAKERRRFLKRLRTADAWVLHARPKPDDGTSTPLSEAYRDYEEMRRRVDQLLDTGKYGPVYSFPIVIKGKKVGT